MPPWPMDGRRRHDALLRLRRVLFAVVAVLPPLLRDILRGPRPKVPQVAAVEAETEDSPVRLRDD
jgi:hypothetical protein